MDLKKHPEIEFLLYFEDIEDPRDELKVLYPLSEILLVGLATIIVGGEGWDDMELFGRTKLKFLKRYLPFEHGIPKAITYERVFSMIKPKEFEECLLKWSSTMPKAKEDRTISIDGKSIRRSHDKKESKSAIHLVSAWGHISGLVLAQEQVSEKSNEITAIPNILSSLNIKGKTVVIDALGCQKSIADDIIKKKGNYVLSLKGNHINTHAEVIRFFNRHEYIGFKDRGYEFNQYETIDKGHGRIEHRKVTLINNVSWLSDIDSWRDISSVVMVESIRIVGGQETREKRYYISSLSIGAKDMLKIVRGHWGIENKLHWVLDVVMGEDNSRVRIGHAQRNLATLRKLALNLIKINKKKKNSIKGSRKLAGWCNISLKRILMF